MFRPPLSSLITPTLALSFHARVDRRAGPDACWPWTGSRTPQGYGRLRAGGFTVAAHQVALLLNGRPLEPGQVTRHLCNAPQCCNPAHLQPGTQQENVEDRRVHGTNLTGERNVRARLTEGEVRVIRQAPASRGVNQRLAERYGVSAVAIGYIRRGVTWRHVR